MNDPDELINLTQKLLVLAGCDASILLTEVSKCRSSQISQSNILARTLIILTNDRYLLWSLYLSLLDVGITHFTD